MKKVLRNSNFVVFLIGYFVSGIGSKLTIIALAHKVLSITGNDFSISLVFLLQSIPMLFLGVISGNFIDKQNKKYAFIIINIIYAFISILLAYINSVPIMYLLIILNGVAKTFYLPTRVALMPLIVEKDDLVEANGLRVSINGIIEISGYGIAGFIVSSIGSKAAFIMDSTSFILVALLSILLKANNYPIKTLSTSNTKTRIKEGWNFIKNHPQIRAMFALDLLAHFIISMQVPLIYVFVEKYLGGQTLMAQRSGLLFSAAGLGTVMGGIIISKFKNYNKLKLLSITLVLDSILLASFSLNRYFPVSVIIFTTLGIVSSFMGSLLETAIQQNTPKSLIGCVLGFMNTILHPVCVISILAGGIFAKFIEVKWVFVIGAFAELITGLYFLIKHCFNFKQVISPSNKKPLKQTEKL